jgi:hypothetical protein
MATKVLNMQVANTCELCGYRSEGTFRDRMRHLKKEHPAYARGVLLRIVAPGLFLVEVLILAAVHAPPWVYIVALFTSFGLLFMGKVRARAERQKAGARPTMEFRRLLREGGLGFLLIVPVIALLIAMLSRR